MKKLEDIKEIKIEIQEGEKGYEECIGLAYLKFVDNNLVWYKNKYKINDEKCNVNNVE